MGFSDFVIERTLNQIRRGELIDPKGHGDTDEYYTGCWISLHSANPETDGVYASEVAGTGYARERAQFGPVSNRSMWVTNPLKWHGLAQNRVTYLGAFDRDTKGHLVFSCALKDPARIIDGNGYQIPADTIALSFGS